MARTVRALRGAVGPWRQAGDRIALIPTMGALHDGHLGLVRLARKRADRVVVSIFVNPTQFAPTEDLATYPRDLGSDIAKLRPLGVDLVWAPELEAMYPSGFATTVSLAGPAAAGLEDAARPHFFAGVATVVAKLFTQVTPDLAVFGEKDYQQLKVVTRMARDLDLPVKVIGAPTRRERDGLAMSSRNVYLSAEERALAPSLHHVLQDTAHAIRSGRSIAASTRNGRAALARLGFRLDYLEARHADTLAPIATLDEGPVRLLAAARLGRTRLIDNIAV